MRIYFVICSLQRPLDDKSQLRVALEAEAVVGVLARFGSETGAVASSNARRQTDLSIKVVSPLELANEVSG